MKEPDNRQDVIFENVWGLDKAPVSDEVLQIWRAFGGPVDESARERLGQIAFVVRNAEGAIVGLSTAFNTYIKRLRNHFYAVRLMLLPGYRMPGLPMKLMVLTRDLLESIHTQERVHPAIGVITLVENKAFKEHHAGAIWRASGMVYIGNSEKGHHIRVYYFKGARILP